MNDVNGVFQSYQLIPFSTPGVVAVGVGKKITDGKQTDEDAIMIFVKEKKPLRKLDPQDVLPAMIQGIKTDVVQGGKIVALPTNKHRPALGGVSIGHYRVSAGTLGATVKDKDTGRLVILSNNHVLADSNNGVVGDPIFQPGPYDGGTYQDEIAALTRFVPIEMNTTPCPVFESSCRFVNSVLEFWGRRTRVGVRAPILQATNVVDAAIATPRLEEDLALEIMVVGRPETELATVTAGDEVQKFGRTTMYTKDKVISTDTVTQVGYGTGVAYFSHQIVVGPMSAGGDSGSLVLDMGNRPVGLLFAGSDDVTIINEIQRVVDLLNIEFV